MIRIQKLLALPYAAALCLALAAACSSGGGSGGVSPAVVGSSGTVTLVTASPSTPPSDITDTGIAGTVAAPAPASFGSVASQIASVGGPSFDGSSGSYPKNATFPLVLSSFQKSSAGLSPASGDPAATATVVSTSASSSVLQLNIPSLGINQTATFNTNLVSHLGQVTDGLSYLVVGVWATRPDTASALQNQTAFLFGYETPATAMPTTGTAAFSVLPGSATAYIYKTANGEIQSSYAEGNAALTVNFSSGQVNGSITNMQLLNTKQPWNDVSVSASIAGGTNRFSGTAAAASSPNNSMSLSSSATGRIDGAFFGPAAQNLGAIWSLSDGTGSALGTIYATH